LIEIGGEIRTKGSKLNDEKWKVGIEKPFENKNSENQLQTIFYLANNYLATSGDYGKYFVVHGQNITHFINPKTGNTANSNLLSTIVITRKYIDINAYTTALMVLGLEKAIEFSNLHPTLEILLIYSDDSGAFKTF
jgi:thiamine biosynthesis lipoprotein